VQRQGDIAITETERKSVFILKILWTAYNTIIQGGGKPEYLEKNHIPCFTRRLNPDEKLCAEARNRIFDPHIPLALVKDLTLH
jgi:Txe/YoeB family toxin of Txe-Axe toxin-antitoxin module